MADRSLHIGVDARELAGQPTGVGRYLAGLLGAWAADAGLPHRFTLFMPDATPELATLGDRFTVAVEQAGQAGTWWEQTRLPRAAARKGVDVWFSPGYTAPLRLPCPSVVAIHDVSFFAQPRWFTWREGTRRRWLTRASARRASVVITISEFSAQEIVRWFGVPRDRIRLAPPGVTRVGALTSRGRAPEPRNPIVLFVGSLFNRRHIPDLVRAFALAAARIPHARLVLVGDNRTQPRVNPAALAASLGVGAQVDCRAYVSDEELDSLYASARVFAFLSDYEGFAMTPLEALAHGVPSVLLNTAVAREVYGPAAARLVSPDVPDIAGALVELLTNETARARILEAGQALLERYSWSRAAATVQGALEDAVRTR